MMNTISIISTKGGVGKTTLCINISALLAELGFKVLVIDCDNQQSLSKFYEYDDNPINGIKEFIIDENLDSITKTHLQNIDIIINNDPSEEINKWMAESSFRTFSLSNSIKKIASQYDYIFIDTNVPSRTVYKHFYTDKKPVFTLDKQDVDNSAINVMKSVVRELFPEIKDLINEGAKL